MSDEETPPYHIERHQESYQILDRTNQVVLNCGDQANAEQYVTLLNKAYKQGYKSGYRTGKQQ